MKLLIFLLVSVASSSVPIYRKESHRQRCIREGNWEEIRMIDQAVKRRHSLINNIQMDSTSQPFYDYADQEYNIRVSVGTPPQIFEVLPDTATANFWVIDKACNDSYDECSVTCQINRDYCRLYCNPKCCNSTAPKKLKLDIDPCANKHVFDQSKSSTYKFDGRSFRLPFGIGNVTGTLGIDTVTLGDPLLGSAAIKVPSTTFGQATRLAKEFAKVPLDGMLGLAYKSVAVDDVQPVFQHALDLGLFDEPVFTIWLGEYGIGSIDKPSGSLVFGGRDLKNCGDDAVFTPLISETVWMFNTDAVAFNDQIKPEPQPAIISTGSAMILMSYSDLMDVVRLSGATYNFQYGFFQLSCDTAFTISVFVGKNEFKVDSKHLIWKLGDGTCLLAADSWGDAPHKVELVLGIPFLRQFCTIFDVKNGRIGFASKLN